MSILPILIHGDPILRQVATPIDAITPKVRQLADDMCETMYGAPGRGLAAPQVGQSVRMFVMDCDWKDGVARNPVVMINPEILTASDEVAQCEEGCLSIPGILVPLMRPARVTMGWTDLSGTRRQGEFTGFAAACVQHEYDHLDGILTIDRMDAVARSAIADALAALPA